MTREEYLKYCSICKNQKLDLQQGLVCGLTNQLADFEGTCESFEEDVDLKVKFEKKELQNEVINMTASLGKRCANYIIDLVFYFIFSTLFGIEIVAILAIVSPESLSFFDQANVLVDYGFGFITGMVYYSFLEAATGRTIGKFITKTKVVDENGKRPDFGTIVLRSLCRFIPFEPFSFLGAESSGWHDKLSKTWVIDVSKTPPGTDK